MFYSIVICWIYYLKPFLGRPFIIEESRMKVDILFIQKPLLTKGRGKNKKKKQCNAALKPPLWALAVCSLVWLLYLSHIPRSLWYFQKYTVNSVPSRFVVIKPFDIFVFSELLSDVIAIDLYTVYVLPILEERIVIYYHFILCNLGFVLLSILISLSLCQYTCLSNLLLNWERK